MATDTFMATATDLDTAGLGLVAAWLSPAYPVGAFAYSHGLECAIADGTVSDAAAVEAWLETLLRQGAGRNDAILLAEAWRTPRDDSLVDLALALQPSAERRLESRMQGAAFASVTAAAFPAEGLGGAAMPYPLAVGHAAAAHGLPLLPVLTLFLQGFAANLVSAAVRLVPLGQTAGQQVLAALMPVCRSVAETTATASRDDLGGFALLADIASMRHETQYSRLFRS
jgi:urease accessory protein